ncbi:gamma carbonic anhydrase family protein [Sphingomonas spermidinifaciens]|uniref:Gamma carbonic anhydrase family protein n=1 Tax=Sphingomonas spermidinifaciens TaxID=1141889 RepID=A0A2A4B645_9SPHN|nr:gamma carbonic anhydrase family protein [Sphingomonas spermidinifaciens]PCD03422.1 gamma carbonic anhydrase family protein [Sphingomonas spermidinifaciens]
MPLYAIDGHAPVVPGSSWVAPSADLIGEVVLGDEVGIWFGAVIRADNTPIVLGDRTNVQEGAMLHSDPGVPLIVGADCTIGHHAILHGCTVGDRVLIGMGATVLNNAVIGDDCLVGAGALLTEGKTFPPGSLIVGSPAKVVRELSPEAIAALKASAAGYAARQAHFRANLTRVD